MSEVGTGRGRRTAALGVFAASLAALASANGAGAETQGKSTVEQRIVPDGAEGYRQLGLGPGEDYTVRESLGTARAGRKGRRRSLLYFGQLSDFQIADEESPARVEPIDTGPFGSAWRPWEALNPQIADAMIRQLNSFSDRSPLASANGTRRAMDFSISTGDLADNQQYNEAQTVRGLLDGGPVNPGSGIPPADSEDPFCQANASAIADAAAPQNYTGVQDYDDYAEGPAPQFYDPDRPSGPFGGFPAYPNLMDAAQRPFEAAGLDAPHYFSFGNHDGLVQGNAAANSGYEVTATGCFKPLSPLVTDPQTLGEAFAAFTPANISNLFASDPSKVGLVPPDPARRFVSKPEYKQILRAGRQADGYGLGRVDPAEEQASNGNAGYYSWRPRPGFRFISLDTVSEGGVPGPSADGNVDDPQFRWLRAELEKATQNDELTVLFSHHPISSLTSDVADEDAPPCTSPDSHGHDRNPGCDLDPRDSSPVRGSADMEKLLLDFPTVIAWVAGHSHRNSIEPYEKPGAKGVFWSIRVASEADWPQQSRLLEIFDNRDGTLSIFGTILDQAAPASAPPPGTDAATLGLDGLASIGRTISYNDPQSGARACGEEACGEGQPKDRNVELLIADPRRGAGGARCANRIEGSAKGERLRGTASGDRIRGRGGRDRISGRGGADCLHGGRGRDRVSGGAGRDRLGGGKGADRIVTGGGKDRVKAGGGADRIRARGGGRDRVRCGRGRGDSARVDRRDRVAGCERVIRGSR